MSFKTKKVWAIVITILLILICTKVEAASASISATSSSVTVGDNVTINVSVYGAAWNLKVSGSGISGGSIVGYDADGNNTSSSQSYALNTSSAGTYTIYLSGDVTDGETDVNSSINKSVTVTVNPKQEEPPTPVDPPVDNTSTEENNSGSSSSESNSGGGSSGNTATTKPTVTTEPEQKPKSSDAKLKGLVVEGYELYPEFNAEIKEYNLKVTNDITSINIMPTCNDNKAKADVEGNQEELEVGPNEFNITVKAEDGTTNTYKITVTREREALKVQTIKISYIDKDGEKKEAVLSPRFSEDVFKYSINNLSYLISKLDIEVLTNLEQAQIKVEGNEKLAEGKNLVKVTVTIPSESEEEEDEVLIYEITVYKEAEPTLTVMGKIKNWFNTNKYSIVMGALILCVAFMAILTIYLIIDYRKYRNLIEKIKVITQFNNEKEDFEEETASTTDIDAEEIEEDSEEETTRHRGRHF